MLWSVAPELVATCTWEGYQRVPTPCGPIARTAWPLLATMPWAVPLPIGDRTGWTNASCGTIAGRLDRPPELRADCAEGWRPRGRRGIVRSRATARGTRSPRCWPG